MACMHVSVLMTTHQRETLPLRHSQDQAKVVLSEGWCLVKGSSTLRYEGKGFTKIVFKRGKISQKLSQKKKRFHKSCLKRGKSLEKLVLKEGWSLIKGSIVPSCHMCSGLTQRWATSRLCQCVDADVHTPIHFVCYSSLHSMYTLSSVYLFMTLKHLRLINSLVIRSKFQVLMMTLNSPVDNALSKQPLRQMNHFSQKMNVQALMMMSSDTQLTQ